MSAPGAPVIVRDRYLDTIATTQLTLHARVSSRTTSAGLPPALEASKAPHPPAGAAPSSLPTAEGEVRKRAQVIDEGHAGPDRLAAVDLAGRATAEIDERGDQQGYLRSGCRGNAGTPASGEITPTLLGSARHPGNLPGVVLPRSPIRSFASGFMRGKSPQTAVFSGYNDSTHNGVRRMSLETWTDERLDDLATTVVALPTKVAALGEAVEHLNDETRALRDELAGETRALREEVAA